MNLELCDHTIENTSLSDMMGYCVCGNTFGANMFTFSSECLMIPSAEEERRLSLMCL